MQTVKTPIRLGGCLSWPESSLGAQVYFVGFVMVWLNYRFVFYSYTLHMKHTSSWFCLNLLVMEEAFLQGQHWSLSLSHSCTHPNITGKNKNQFEPCHMVCDQVSLKQACSAMETNLCLENLDLGSIWILLSRQRTTKVLIRLFKYAGWSVSLEFAYGINRFSHVVACLYCTLKLTSQWNQSTVIYSIIICHCIWAATWQNQQNECAPNEDSD